MVISRLAGGVGTDEALEKLQGRGLYGRPVRIADAPSDTGAGGSFGGPPSFQKCPD